MNTIASLKKLADSLNSNQLFCVSVDSDDLPFAYSKEDLIQFARTLLSTFSSFEDMQEYGNALDFTFTSKTDADVFARDLRNKFFQDSSQNSSVRMKQIS